VLDFAFKEFNVLDAGLFLIFARQCKHRISHIQPVGLAGRSHTASREQHVDTAT